MLEVRKSFQLASSSPYDDYDDDEYDDDDDYADDDYDDDDDYADDDDI